MRAANKVRGEVAVNVGGVELILCAEMARLEALETATGGLSLSAFMAALRENKVSILKAALGALTIEGDAATAWAGMVGLAEFPKLQRAIIAALVPGGDDEGNADAGAETA